MATLWTALADEVKVALEYTVTTAQGTIERVYVPQQELKDLAADNGPTVSVMARSEDQVRLTRTAWQRDTVISVAVQKRVEDDAAADLMTAFMEELVARIKTTAYTVPAKLIGVTNAPLYAPGLLREKRVYFSVIQATFRTGSAP